jgi:hypothetical protein
VDKHKTKQTVLSQRCFEAAVAGSPDRAAARFMCAPHWQTNEGNLKQFAMRHTAAAVVLTADNGPGLGKAFLTDTTQRLVSDH